MKLGIDKGSAYTKTVHKSIKSVVRKVGEGEIRIEDFAGGYDVVIGGQRYIVGHSGLHAADLLKSQQSETSILVKTIIALSLPVNNEVVDIVLGLPFSQYGSQKQQMKNIFENTQNIVIIKNEKKNFYIRKVEIFPEDAGAFYSLNTAEYRDKRVLLIDIGGLSVDAVEFIYKIMGKYSTYQLGTMKLFEDVANRINAKYQTNFTFWDVERIVERGLTIEGKVESVNFIEPMLAEHAEEIVRRIKLSFDVKSYDIILFVGGGSIALWKFLHQMLRQSVLVAKPQKANVFGFQQVAEVAFQ